MLRFGKYTEMICWILAIGALATSNPHEHHYSLCPIANLGFDFCPGCGLGRSISALLQGEIATSFSLHWFGIPATGILIYRIYQLAKQTFINKNNYLKIKEA